MKYKILWRNPVSELAAQMDTFVKFKFFILIAKVVMSVPMIRGAFSSHGVPVIASTASAPPTPIASIPRPPALGVCESDTPCALEEPLCQGRSRKHSPVPSLIPEFE